RRDYREEFEFEEKDTSLATILNPERIPLRVRYAPREEELKAKALEASRIMEDALLQSPRHHVRRRIEWLADVPSSAFGREVKAMDDAGGLTQRRLGSDNNDSDD